MPDFGQGWEGIFDSQLIPLPQPSCYEKYCYESEATEKVSGLGSVNRGGRESHRIEGGLRGIGILVQLLYFSRSGIFEVAAAFNPRFIGDIINFCCLQKPPTCISMGLQGEIKIIFRLLFEFLNGFLPTGFYIPFTKIS